MISLYYIGVLCYIISSAKSFLVFLPNNGSSIPLESSIQFGSGDAGDPLFLTPYIQSGKTQEGRKLARVSLTDELNITSYSGYITVNEKYDSNMFFWYFPAIAADQKKAPVVVWLQGGPGATSLFGLFEENGPLRVVDGKIVRREITWASDNHMIFIDNPVGTGFSFTNDTAGYCTDESQVGEQLHNMLTQFFQLFPDIQKNDFFITGESYAGKYVPALGYTIHKKNPTSKVKINLKGLAIGDGWTDPENMLVYDKYLYQLGIIDWNQAQVMRKIQNAMRQYIKEKQYDKAFDSFGKILEGYVHSVVSEYNYLEPPSGNVIYDTFGQIMNKASVQKAIHVGNRSFLVLNWNVYSCLKNDFTQTVAPWLSELLEHYPVMTYNGELDIIVAYPLTVNYLRKLNFTGAKEYETAPRKEWRVDGVIAGFVKQAGRLTEVMVRDAGHMVPKDQPKWALNLITRFMQNQIFY